MSDKPEAMTEAHTPTPQLELIYGGSGPEARAAIVGDAENMVRILVDCRRTFTDPEPLASLIVLAVNSHARLQRVADAARALDTAEDFSEPIGPGQDPQDWEAYNALRRELGEALADLNDKD